MLPPISEKKEPKEDEPQEEKKADDVDGMPVDPPEPGASWPKDGRPSEGKRAPTTPGGGPLTPGRILQTYPGVVIEEKIPSDVQEIMKKVKKTRWAGAKEKKLSRNSMPRRRRWSKCGFTGSRRQWSPRGRTSRPGLVSGGRR